MAQTITITLEDSEYKALEYIADSPENWIDTAATERARKATKEIVDIVVRYCLDNGIQIPTTEAEIIDYAYDNALIKTGAQRNAEAQAEVI